MAVLWLTPLALGSTVAFGGDRLPLVPSAEADTFRELMNEVHPRLLMSFKANLLLSEDAELACGIDELPFTLDDGQPIEFGSERLELSHCAVSFMDRIAAPGQCAAWLEQAAGIRMKCAADPYAGWIDKMRQWYAAGLHVILLKED